MAEVVSNSWTWTFSVGCLWHTTKKSGLVCFWLYEQLQSPPIGLRKIFIDYFFFQADKWDSTKSLSIDLLPLNNVSERAKYVACQGYGIRDFGILANHGKRPSRPRPNYLFLFWVFPIMILFRLGLLEVWLEVSGWRFLPCRARVQFFSFLMENTLTMGGQIA